MARLRVALFGSSTGFSAAALGALAPRHDVVAAIRPSGPGLRGALRQLAGIEGPGPLESLARELGVAVLDAGRMDAAFVHRLGALKPDLIAIALFPRLIPALVTDLAPAGALNLHPSLLPRHRGPLPLFWTYHAGDRKAGVTVHHASDRMDAGDIVLQEAFELERGYPAAELDRDVATHGAALLARAVDAVAAGNATRTAQDESAATLAPLVEPGAAMTRFDAWDVEQVWHFLAGLFPRYREPLVDDSVTPVHYTAVLGYSRSDRSRPAGHVERRDGRLLLHCRGGCVELAQAARYTS